MIQTSGELDEGLIKLRAAGLRSLQVKMFPVRFIARIRSEQSELIVR